MSSSRASACVVGVVNTVSRSVSPCRTTGFAGSEAVYTNKANCGSYRGPGAPQAVFAGESQLDRIADELGVDRLQLRLDNAVRDGDLGPEGRYSPECH